jgi:diaminopimelate epimerase
VRVTVQSGEELEVSFKETNDNFTDVRLTGPADFVFDGEMEI